MKKLSDRPMAQYVAALLEGFLESLERLKKRPERSDLIDYEDCSLCYSFGYLVEEVRFLRVGDVVDPVGDVSYLQHSSGSDIRINRLTPCPACACSGGAMVWVLK